MLTTGQVIGGRYRLDEALGAGGEAVVWGASDITTGQSVVLKLLAGDHPELHSAVGVFVQRARASSARLHPAIVSVRELGRTDAGQPFVVMERVAGTSLHRILEDDGALMLPRAVAVMVRLLEAMAAAHEHGATHGNLKPENIIFGPQDASGQEVYLLNFGLSRSVIAAPGDTAPRYVLGPLDYLAPERLAAPGSSPSLAADVFACAVIFGEMILGRPSLAPLRPDDPSLQPKLVERNNYYRSGQSLPLPSQSAEGIPKQIDDLLRRATAVEPQERFPDCSAMLAALDEITDDAPELLAASVYDGGTLRLSLPDQEVEPPGLGLDKTVVTSQTFEFSNSGAPSPLAFDDDERDTLMISDHDDDTDTVETEVGPEDRGAPPRAPGFASPFDASTIQEEEDEEEEDKPNYAKTMVFDASAASPSPLPAPKPRDEGEQGPVDGLRTQILPPTASDPALVASGPKPVEGAEASKGLAGAATMLFPPSSSGSAPAAPPAPTEAATMIFEPGSAPPVLTPQPQSSPQAPQGAPESLTLQRQQQLSQGQFQPQPQQQPSSSGGKGKLIALVVLAALFLFGFLGVTIAVAVMLLR